jgi:hypothetical protein
MHAQSPQRIGCFDQPLFRVLEIPIRLDHTQLIPIPRRHPLRRRVSSDWVPPPASRRDLRLEARLIPALGGESRDLAAHSRREVIRRNRNPFEALADNIRDLSGGHAIPAAEDL